MCIKNIEKPRYLISCTSIRIGHAQMGSEHKHFDWSIKEGVK